MWRNALKAAIALTAILLLAVVVRIGSWAVPHDLDSSKESVRLRNSLIADTVVFGATDWNLADMPSDFKLDTGPIPREMGEAWAELEKGLPSNVSDLDRALAISVHLRANATIDRPLVSNTVDSYRQMVQKGYGFCSDYTQVFNGMAFIAGLPVREWGLAFDGYGGAGHAINEFYDRSLGKWVFIDNHGSVYVRRVATGEVLSAMEYRSYLLIYDDYDAAKQEIELVPIVPDKLAFKSLEKTFAFHRRGAEQFYLVWGNNVFSYDANPFVRAASRVSRSAEQVVGIALGLLPEIRLILEPRTKSAVETLFALRDRFLIYVSAAVLLFVLLTIELGAYFYTRKGHVHPSKVTVE